MAKRSRGQSSGWVPDRAAEPGSRDDWLSGCCLVLALPVVLVVVLAVYQAGWWSS